MYCSEYVPVIIAEGCHITMQEHRDLKPAQIIETWQIWEESGIAPEPGWLIAVECLHRHAMHEPEPATAAAPLSTSSREIIDTIYRWNSSFDRIADSTLFREIIDTASSHPGFRVLDRQRMLTYARLCGHDVTGRSDYEIALQITRTILSDYGVHLPDIHGMILPIAVHVQGRSSGCSIRPSGQPTIPSGITL